MQFEFTEELYKKSESSERGGTRLCRILAADAIDKGGKEEDAIFSKMQDMAATIDDIAEGEAPWREFKVKYTGPLEANSPPWMRTEYAVHCCDTLTVVENMARSEDFKDAFDYVPYQEFTTT